MDYTPSLSTQMMMVLPPKWALEPTIASLPICISIIILRNVLYSFSKSDTARNVRTLQGYRCHYCNSEGRLLMLRLLHRAPMSIP